MADGKEMEQRRVGQLPLYMVALHRLAKMGRATKYIGEKRRYVLFRIEYPLSAKMVGLRDVESVSIIYRERKAE